MLVSAPLYLYCQIFKVQGPYFSAGGIKGFAPLPDGTKTFCFKFGNTPALPLRGGNWADLLRAGVFALNLNNSRATSAATVGFRAALPLLPDMQNSRVLRQCRGDKGVYFHAVQKGKKQKSHGSR